MHSQASADEKRYLLNHPHFIEALHALAPCCNELADWDATVAPGCYRAPADRQAALAPARLGNVAAAVQVRQRRDWRGEIELATDDYGRIRFPFCDWTLVLTGESNAVREPFAHRRVTLRVDDRAALWSLPEEACPRLVRMPSAMFDAMIVDNYAEINARGLEFGPGPPWPRFERASQLGNTSIRYEPIGVDPPEVHAATTGGLIETLLSAIETNAPLIHGQLAQCVRAIHGFELPPCPTGHVASFSVPTTPGVIGLNVEYTRQDEPRLSPYAFMWLGHELGHTLHYLIDDVAYASGWRFLENPRDTTPVLPRYGRGLGVRTLFQMPYVHLFEWWLLIQFYEQDFAGLPWRMFDDAYLVGEDVREEIREAIDLIDAHARLTCAGQAVFQRIRELVTEADARWQALTHRAASVARCA